MIPYQHRTISDTGITDRKTQRQNKNWVKMGLLIVMSISLQEKVCEPLDFSCVPKCDQRFTQTLPAEKEPN